jgi:hypothetical protein
MMRGLVVVGLLRGVDLVDLREVLDSTQRLMTFVYLLSSTNRAATQSSKITITPQNRTKLQASQW